MARPILSPFFLAPVALLAAATLTGQERDLVVTESNERRVALVVGNNEYQHAPGLRNAVNDAEDLSSALSDLGFEVDVPLNAGSCLYRADVLERIGGWQKS